MAEGLGRMTPGDDYRRLVPLMEGIPLWAHVLAVAAGACYSLAIVCLVRRRRAASVALMLGVAIEVMGTVMVRPIIEEIGVRAVAQPSLLAAVILPLVLPLLLALAAWSGSRRESDSNAS
jgi:hypothetical protein